MKVLVTGANGFIGRHTVRLLQNSGHEVYGMDKEPETCHLGDVTNMNNLNIDFERFQPEAVIHLAAQSCVAVSARDWAYDAEQNIIGTINVVKACQEHGVKRLIFASSGGTVYGHAPVPFTENMPLSPVSPYGISKLAAECYTQISGVPYIILRYPNVYGPGQSPDGESGVVAIFIDRISRGLQPQIFGNGMKIRDYVYVEDVAEANRLSLTGPTGIYNIGSGIGTSDLGVFNIIADAMKWEGGAELLPDRLHDVQEVVLDASKANNYMFLDWQPNYPFEVGIKETLEAVYAVANT